MKLYKNLKHLTIAVLGAECTGKSTLIRQLCQKDPRQRTWVAEYARSYVEDLQRPAKEEDAENILKGQYSWELQARRWLAASPSSQVAWAEPEMSPRPVLFFDTNLFMATLYDLYYNGPKAEPEQQAYRDRPAKKIWRDKALAQSYDQIWVCAPDPAWTPEESQRSHSRARDEVQTLLSDQLAAEHLRFEGIQGSLDQREQQAEELIERFFRSSFVGLKRPHP